mmetsp:Transcript_15744/g.36969  ORF Transcript_15744/g.36969 Transcript_15744/m.36969 type:complete len:628 (-) Transcript_15744:16-1899(-)
MAELEGTSGSSIEPKEGDRKWRDYGGSEVTIASLKRELKEADGDDEKCALLDRLADMGEDAALYLGLGKIIINGLFESPEAQRLTCLTLAKMGAEGARYADKVAAKLSTQNPAVLAAALAAMSSFGVRAHQHVQDVAKCMSSSNAEVRAAACRALGRLGTMTHREKVAEALQDSSPAVVASACEVLGERYDADAAIAASVAKQLQSTTPEVSRAAVSFFVRCPMLAGTHWSSLLQCLSSKDAGVRERCLEAIAALAHSGSAPTTAGADLASLLASSDGSTRTAAAVALRSFPEAASGHAQTLAGLLADDFFDEQSAVQLQAASLPPLKLLPLHCKSAAALTLAGLGGKAAEPHLLLLLPLLDSKEEEVRLAGLRALRLLGAAVAPQALQKVKAMCADKVACVRAEALLTFASLGGAASEVAEKLSSPVVVVRRQAAAALGLLGSAALESSDDLISAFKDRSAEVRAEAVRALASLGPRSQLYVGDISRMLSDPDGRVRVAAISSLCKLGERGASFIDDVAEALWDPVAEVRVAALAAVAGWGNLAFPLLASIRRMRSEAVFAVRCEACRALARLQGSTAVQPGVQVRVAGGTGFVEDIDPILEECFIVALESGERCSCNEAKISVTS